MKSIINYYYTLPEVAIALNFSDEEKNNISYYAKYKDLNKIMGSVPKLNKFRPFVRLIKVQKKEIYAIPAKVFDLYLKTGILPDLEEIDVCEKKEYWEYNSPSTFEMTTKDNWEFGMEYFKAQDSRIDVENIWDIFLSGCARMNYYQDTQTTIEQRIKYAIMEYMIRRPQFFTTDDFVDNPLLHKKYKNNSIQN